GIEQVQRHLESAEHDHDHARAHQQRSDLGGDGRWLLVAVLGWVLRFPGLIFGLGLFLGLLVGLLVAGLLGGRSLRRTARGGDEARGRYRLLRRRRDFADRAFGSGDALGRRGEAATWPCAGLERVIGRQLGRERRTRRRGRRQDVADR